MNDTILINRLPTRTWNRLGVNETAIAWGQADDLGEEKITAVRPSGLRSLAPASAARRRSTSTRPRARPSRCLKR